MLVLSTTHSTITTTSILVTILRMFTLPPCSTKRVRSPPLKDATIVRPMVLTWAMLSLIAFPTELQFLLRIMLLLGQLLEHAVQLLEEGFCRKRKKEETKNVNKLNC